MFSVNESMALLAQGHKQYELKQNLSIYKVKIFNAGKKAGASFRQDKQPVQNKPDVKKKNVRITDHRILMKTLLNYPDTIATEEFLVM